MRSMPVRKMLALVGSTALALATVGVMATPAGAGQSGSVKASSRFDSYTCVLTGTFSWNGLTNPNNPTIAIYKGSDTSALVANSVLTPAESGSVQVTYDVPAGTSGKYVASGSVWADSAPFMSTIYQATSTLSVRCAGPSVKATISFDNATCTLTGVFAWRGMTSPSSASVGIYRGSETIPLAANANLWSDPYGSVAVTYVVPPGTSGKYSATGSMSDAVGTISQILQASSNGVNARCP